MTVPPPSGAGARTTGALAGHQGLPLAFDVRGTPERGTVLMLHGGAQTRHAWDYTAERVALAGFRAVTLDLRGHGESGWPADGDYTEAAFMGDVRAVLDAFGPCAVVGASLGGIVALLATATPRCRPDLTALVMVDIAPRMEPAGVDRIVGFMTAHPDGFTSAEAAADAIAAYLPHRPRPTDLGGLGKNLRQREDGRYVWHWDLTLLRAGNLAANRDSTGLRDAAAALDLPTLLVRGSLSDLLSDEGVREFLELCPGAATVDVRGAHHMVVGDRNDAFCDAVIAFVSQLSPPGG